MEITIQEKSERWKNNKKAREMQYCFFFYTVAKNVGKILNKVFLKEMNFFVYKGTFERMCSIYPSEIM